MKLLDLHLGEPLHRGALSLFPVWNGAAVASRGYDLRTSDLDVSERAGSAVVGELVVTNAGKRPALLLEGELLEGGQQHRVCSRSVLIDAGEFSRAGRLLRGAGPLVRRGAAPPWRPPGPDLRTRRPRPERRVGRGEPLRAALRPQ